MIESFIKRKARQTAVYWGTPTLRSDGSNLYPAPVEIKCFWIDGFSSSHNKEMKEVSIQATVYVFQDLAEQGMLFLGTLASLSQAQKDDPRKVSRAYEITRFAKTPSLHVNGTYNRVAYISPERSNNII